MTTNKGFYDENALWDFALRVYSSPEFAQLSLQLQHNHQANINIMLWCCWLKYEGLKVPVTCLDNVLITVDKINQLTVVRLRELRQQIKEHTYFTKVQSQAINRHILNAELAIEKVLLQRLQDQTPSYLDEHSAKSGDKQPYIDLTYYLNFLNISKAPLYAQTLMAECDRVFL